MWTVRVTEHGEQVMREELRKAVQDRLSFLAALIRDRCPPEVQAELMTLVDAVAEFHGVTPDPEALRKVRITGEGAITIKGPVVV